MAESLKAAPSKLSNRYRGATVEDLDPPRALSCSPTDSISHALQAAYERDYTHLTVTSPTTRALLGYFSIPHMRILLDTGKVAESDPVSAAMIKFRRRGRVYQIITMDTPLEDLERFFQGRAPHDPAAAEGVPPTPDGPRQDFAVVTDDRRRFVLGVATRADLDEFARRRPA